MCSYPRLHTLLFLTIFIYHCSEVGINKDIMDIENYYLQDISLNRDIKNFQDIQIRDIEEDLREDIQNFDTTVRVDIYEENDNIPITLDTQIEDLLLDTDEEIVDSGIEEITDAGEEILKTSDVYEDVNNTLDAIDPDVSVDIRPVPHSIIDTISLNPTGKKSGTGLDMFGAGTSSGFDYAFGFAFKVSNSHKIYAIEFLALQEIPGSNIRALLYRSRNISGGSEASYWLPHYSTTPEATFELVIPLPEPDNKEPYLFRFETPSPYPVEPDTPYVIVFDPEPNSSGQGVYKLPQISEEEGFLSATGIPEVDVFMPPYTIKRMLDLTPPQGIPYYSVWSFLRMDKRYLVRVFEKD